MLRILIRNAVSNWIGFVVHAIVTFFLTPFILDSLGATQYGIWALVTGMCGYYGLIDLGFRSGITQYMTRSLAERDFEKLNRTVSTAFVGLAACTLLILCLSCLLAYFAPFVFDLPSEAITESRWCILVIGCSMGVQFLFFPFSATFVATQRYDIANIVTIVMRLVGAAAVFVALRAGYGLIGLSVVGAASELVAYLIRWRIARRILPELSISLRLVHCRGMAEVVIFSGWMVLIEGANRLIYGSDAIVIGLFMPVAAIAPFALAIGLAEYYANMFRPLGSICYPAATQLDAEGRLQDLRELYLKATRVLMMLTATCGIIGLLWATDFFRLWLGNEVRGAKAYATPAYIFRVLIIGAVFIASQRVGYQILLGMRRQKRLCMLLVAEGLANVVLSVILIQRFGLLGVALGTTIPAVIFQAVMVPRELCRTLEMSRSTYLWELCYRPTKVACTLAMILTLLHYLLPPALNWLHLILQGLMAATISLVAVSAIGFDREERVRYVRAPLTSVAKKCLVWISHSESP